ncbi:MAG: peptidoglycan DD-metalloendopeptidase family protein [Alphaproteobacteria bacterium]|nr:peptidoglycan DD-metalloendopeptidase family protein [Alphaproteobacteria bacterium]
MRQLPITPPSKSRRLERLAGLAGCVLISLVTAESGWAQSAAPTAAEGDPAGRLQRIERNLETGQATRARLNRLSRDLADEIAKLRTRMAKAASQAQSTERTAVEVVTQLAALRDRAGAARAQLADRHSELGRLIGALQRLARRPPETLLLMRRPPLETVHTGILLEAAIPRVNAKATQLRVELANLAALEAEIDDQRARLDAATAALALERAHLTLLAAEKAALLESTEHRAEGMAEQVQQLAESARSLRELVQSLDAQATRERAEQERLTALVQPEPRPSSESTVGGAAIPRTPALAFLPGAPAVSTVKGELFSPVSGQMTRRFGQPDPEGLRDRGVVLKTSSGATVVAPYDGTVLYAGVFEGFGLILIIEHGEGYHTLLAGLGRIDLGVGQRVLAGEPVGAMGAPGSAGVGQGPELYVELRHNGDPIDPLPWFAGLSEKAKG